MMLSDSETTGIRAMVPTRRERKTPGIRLPGACTWPV